MYQHKIPQGLDEGVRPLGSSLTLFGFGGMAVDGASCAHGRGGREEREGLRDQPGAVAA